MFTASVPAHATAHPPGYGFGSFVLVAIVVAFLVSMVRNLRSHTAEADDAAEAGAAQGIAATATASATAARPRERLRDRAGRSARQAFRRSRAHGWLRRHLLPGEHGDPTPAAALADGVAGAFAVFAYAAGFAAGLAHAKTAPAPRPAPTAPAGPSGGADGTPPRPGTAAPGSQQRERPGQSKRRRLYGLTGWLRRKPMEGEIVDPEPVTPRPAIATAADEIIDAVPLEDLHGTQGATPAPEPTADPEPQPQGAPPMAFIQTIHELISWAKDALGAADSQAADAGMRAKAAAGRAEDAAAVATTATKQANALYELSEHWSTQKMDQASLQSVFNASDAAARVSDAELSRAESESATAHANGKVVVAIAEYREALAEMSATVHARQMQHAEAQAATGNAAAAPAVLEGA